MKYIIGIDSGATKSELVAYDLEFRPIYNRIGGYGNPSVNLSRTIGNITNLVNQCLEDLKEYECQFMAIGMAGIETGNYEEIIKRHINTTFSIKSIVLNDVIMAAKAYLGNEDGILSIAGTGSVSYAQKDNTGMIVGGWGHILGDKGSGYHTVIEGFKRITWQIDHDILLDNLSKRLMEEINAKDSSDIKKFIYMNEKSTIASLFPVIVDLSNEGDMVSTQLLENAGKYLAEDTIAAYNKFKFHKKVRIGLKGGVFYNSHIVLSSFEKNLTDSIEDYILIKEDISVAKAVCNIYKSRG